MFPCIIFHKPSVRVWGGQGYPNKHHEHFKVIFSITREEIELPVKISDKSLNLTRPNPQRPQKSDLSGWQLSTGKNFPGKVRKLLLRQKKTRKSFLQRKKGAQILFVTKKCINSFCDKKSVCKSFLQQKKCGQINFATKSLH